MKAFLPTGDVSGETSRSTPDAGSPAEGDEPVPSDGFRAAALLDVRGLQIARGARTDAPILATGISLSLAHGEVLGLVGHAGSGAAEIARAVSGRLAAPDRIVAGSIRLDGTELVGIKARPLERLHGTTVALVPADAATRFAPHRAIGRQLTRPLRRTLGLSRAAAARRMLDSLDRAGVEDPRHAATLLPGQFSRLTLHRVLIADAVGCGPDLLIVDDRETPSGQTEAAEEDAAFDAAIAALYRSLRRERSLAMIIVSRDLGDAVSGCDRVAVLDAGRIVEQGSTAEIVSAPQHPRTRLLLDTARTRRA